MKKKAQKGGSGWIVAVLIVLAIVGFGSGYLKLGATTGSDGSANDQTSSTKDCQTASSYTNIARDNLNGVSIGGTTYYKVNGLPATTSTTVVAGKSLQVWTDNSTYFCNPESVPKAECGAQIIEQECVRNGTSLSMKFWDNANGVFLTASGGANNLTMGANTLANVRIDYQGTAKQANMPFGGCVVVEVPSTISSVSLSGAGISSNVPCPYVYTYSTQATTNTYFAYAVPAGFDKDGLGDIKSIAMQIQAGSSDPSAVAYVTLQPADYYVGNDGNLYLGLQKDKNADTTKVRSAITASFKIQ